MDGQATRYTPRGASWLRNDILLDTTTLQHTLDDSTNEHASNLTLQLIHNYPRR
ncbi:hypothetical protein PISMIDRAFT_685185 [Pisolithus microcarpus 441]|uniref:Uncharacterized protein n=1 Tax=Pisolithus microcarpus 441 TaxID=765257 RepID=A0A0C9ZC91_9AGAM|nr:hypothetical protein PISMIDRAFT_685185 [Pisolithus microcarpus 441]